MNVFNHSLPTINGSLSIDIEATRRDKDGTPMAMITVVLSNRPAWSAVTTYINHDQLAALAHLFASVDHELTLWMERNAA